LIRGARVQKNMSQNDLAVRSGMKQPDISKIEEGKKNITLGTLAVLCRVLGIKEIKLG
jgi:transcriptional regulator with XRE-family HTH domain